MLTFGSLFAGIGGFDLGLERAGMVCKWQAEIDLYCRQVLTKHWPDVPKYSDIREVDWNAVERVDLVCGGFPCQPVSLAGKRRAQEDDRWLWPEFARVIRAIRPRYVLVENVPGLLSRGMGDVLGDLASSRYDAEWQSLPAAAFGAPHIRERVWIIAYASGTSKAPIVESSRATRTQLQPRRFRRHSGRLFTERWPYEHIPRMVRVDDGLSSQLDKRLSQLGNAVVPQVAEWLGRRILAACEARDD